MIKIITSVALMLLCLSGWADTTPTNGNLQDHDRDVYCGCTITTGNDDCTCQGCNTGGTNSITGDCSKDLGAGNVSWTALSCSSASANPVPSSWNIKTDTDDVVCDKTINPKKKRLKCWNHASVKGHKVDFMTLTCSK